MFIYKDIYAADFLIKTNGGRYEMKLNGYACGGFSAASDADALEIFKSIIEGEK